MKLLMHHLPAGLQGQRTALENCILAMQSVMPLKAVYLFGSHARGDADQQSDVDLCVVSDEAEHPFAASQRLSEAILNVWPRPAFTLIPITSVRLAEKRAIHDPFFDTVLGQGVLLASED